MHKRLWFIVIMLLIPIFLFPADNEKQVVIKQGEKNRAWLGVVVQNLSNKMLENLNLESGVRIIKVAEESPAKDADLQEEDIIISLDGQVVKDTESLLDLVKEKKIGDEVMIEYLRAGKHNTVKVKLAESPMKKIRIRAPRGPFRFDMLTEDQTWLGVFTIELTEQLRTYFAVPQGQGVLIKEVVKDSPAEKGGLKAGDVIIKVAQKKVQDLKDIKRAINYFEPGDEIEIKVIRDKKEKTFNVKLEENKQKGSFNFYNDEDHEYQIPLPFEVNVDVPEIEINQSDMDLDDQQIQDELQQKFEWQLKGLDVKLKDLDKKMKNLQIKMISEDESEI